MAVKRFITLVALAAAALFVLAAPASAQIAGSKHDLSAYTNTVLPAGFYPCQACHAPHPMVGTVIADVPLGNREYAPAAATYTTYTNTGGVTTGDPTGVDLLCLSCHDGSVGTPNVEAFGVNTAGSFGGAAQAGTNLIGALTGGPVTGNGAVGQDLSTSHPVSKTYTAAAGSYHPIVGSTVDNGTTSVPIYGGEVKCASCHNVHDQTNGYFLRLAPASLCSTCHIK